mgnify:CR=1 FL=1
MVGDQHADALAGQIADHGADVGDGQGIDAGEGFVQQPQRDALGKRQAGERGAAALAEALGFLPEGMRLLRYRLRELDALRDRRLVMSNMPKINGTLGEVLYGFWRLKAPLVHVQIPYFTAVRPAPEWRTLTLAEQSAWEEAALRFREQAEL